MKLTPEIRRKLEEREHVEKLVHDLENNLEETKRLIEKHNRTLKLVNFQLGEWDKFSNENKKSNAKVNPKTYYSW
jgi:hypothetical protein